MTETLNESVKKIVAAASVLLSILAGIWWGCRMGSGLYYLVGWDLRPFLSILMLLGLLFQGYSNIKKDRRYSALYCGLLWCSGILVSLIVYGLMIVTVGDFLVLMLRGLFRIRRIYGKGGIFSTLFGIERGLSLRGIGHTFGSSVLNYANMSLLANALSIGITIYGLIHARHLQVRSYHFHRSVSEQSRRDASGPRIADHACRIVQLSDLHMGSVVNRSYMHKIVKKVMKLKPDYVVITGDIFNHGFVEEYRHPEETESDFRELNRCCFENAAAKETTDNASAKNTCNSNTCSSRIYAILGNHDPEPSDKALQNFLEKSDITLLNDQSVNLPEFYLVGRGSNHLIGRPELSSWMPHFSNDKPVILLDHYPDGIQEAQDSGVDLMLCGHTHSGQYFPCNYLIRKQYAHGLIRGYSEWGGTKLIVSSGTGFFQIPIRVGTDSEIVCVDLV